jgi:hypothetical protein
VMMPMTARSSKSVKARFGRGLGWWFMSWGEVCVITLYIFS